VPELTEAYSCAGSPYWAAKGLAPLLLPRGHAFWEAPEEPLPAEQSDHAHAVPQAGLVVRSHQGDVEVLNNANGICVGNIKFGTWKWGKLSFRSGVGGEIAPADNRYPLDAALSAEFEDGSVSGRHQCQPIAVSPDHCGSVYGLGNRFSQNHVSVETRIWWNGGWQLHWHRVVAYQKSLLRHGSYSLPLEKIDDLRWEAQEGYARAERDRLGVAIQPLLGFAHVFRNDSSSKRRAHFAAPHSVLLTAETAWMQGERELLVLTWVGKTLEEGEPWSVLTSENGFLLLRHARLGEWAITESAVPECSTESAT
jgi:hypothetical protein